MNDNNYTRLYCILLILATGLLPAISQAANWLMLQGTEPGKANFHRWFGFVTLEVQRTGGSNLPTGAWAGQEMGVNQIGPDLTDNAKVQIPIARVALRGQAFDGKLNYFVSPLMGKNGIIAGSDPNIEFTDVSVTLNTIPYARIRAGQFKYPGSEEGMEPGYLRIYNNPTMLASMLVQEPFLDADGSHPTDPNLPNGPVSGFRDLGVQLFDAFRHKDWEHTYALMVGTGNGISRADNNSNKDLYLYWSSEKLMGGQGPMRQGLKLFAWRQSGERKLLTSSNTVENSYDRKRYGIGTTFRKGPYRARAEWIKGKGMIFSGIDSNAVPGARSNNNMMVASYNMLPDDEARGWYLDLGYQLTPKLALDLRYDQYNMSTTVAANEKEFKTWTLGAQYKIDKNIRVVGNYEARDYEAIGESSTSTSNQILDQVDNRVSLRLYYLFL